MSEKTAIETQIEQEARELNAVPKIPVHRFMNPGTFARCHICGQVFNKETLKSYDGHTGKTRFACRGCNPSRSSYA